jgi:ribonuclease Z
MTYRSTHFPFSPSFAGPSQDFFGHCPDAMTRPQLMEVDRIRRVIGDHSTPQDATRVFRQARPRLAVFDHLLLIGDDICTSQSVQELIETTRTEYDGNFVVGEDLMSFHIGQEITTSALPLV